jgi:ribose transport system permease protein
MKTKAVLNKNRYRFRGLIDSLGMCAVLAALIIFFSIKSPRFLTATNFSSITTQIPADILIAVGMTFVLIIAGIDLSVGSVVGVAGAVVGLCIGHAGMPLPVAILGGLAAGLLCGAINGLVIVRWSLPPFIVTLGMLEVARGATFLLTGTQTIYLGSKIGGLANVQLGSVSSLFVLAIAVVIGGQLVLARTAFGRHMVAIGTNERAAYLSGINTSRIKLAVYALSGLLCSVAALINMTRTSSADPNAGTGSELAAIAAVVIGGTSLMGGRGGVIFTLIGTLIIGYIGKILSLRGAEEHVRLLAKGGIIVIAVLIQQRKQT